VGASLTQVAIQPEFRIPLPGGIPFGLMGAPSLAAALLTGPLGALAALPLLIQWQSLPAVATLRIDEHRIDGERLDLPFPPEQH
jgi:hypothetical protein